MVRNAALRCLLVLTFSAASILSIAKTASGALCVEWADPATVTTNDLATISFQTYVPMASGEDDRIHLVLRAFRDYPFRVRAVAPSGDVLPLDMRPETDSARWTGHFTPSEAGTWNLKVLNMQGGDTQCYVDRQLAVVDAPTDRAPFIVIALAILVSAAVSGLLIVRRQKESRSVASLP